MDISIVEVFDSTHQYELADIYRVADMGAYHTYRYIQIEEGPVLVFFNCRMSPNTRPTDGDLIDAYNLWRSSAK
jgi:hypothetical protein